MRGLIHLERGFNTQNTMKRSYIQLKIGNQMGEGIELLEHTFGSGDATSLDDIVLKSS